MVISIFILYIILRLSQESYHLKLHDKMSEKRNDSVTFRQFVRFIIRFDLPN